MGNNLIRVGAKIDRDRLHGEKFEQYYYIVAVHSHHWICTLFQRFSNVRLTAAHRGIEMDLIEAGFVAKRTEVERRIRERNEKKGGRERQSEAPQVFQTLTGRWTGDR